MAQNNAINNRTSQLTTDPGVVADSFNQFAINGTDKFRIGVDDSQGDTFKISEGGSLGTNDTFSMTSDGERRLPLNPCFHAYLDGDENNVTGTGTIFELGTIRAFTEVFDQGSNLSLSPGTFTAPITGRYLLTVNCSYRGVSTGVSTSSSTNIATSNRDHRIIDAYTTSASGSAFGMNISMIVDMDAADTAVFEAQITGLPADTADIDGSVSGGFSSIGGVLIS